MYLSVTNNYILPYSYSPVDSDSLYEVALSGPISLLTTWLQPFTSSSPMASSQEKSGRKRRWADWLVVVCLCFD